MAMGNLADGSNSWGGREKGSRSRLHIWLAHQAFAYEKGFRAIAGEGFEVVMVADAAFADEQ